ncbi:MAG TPA: hypothetical protein VEV84_13280 [Pyrinomonadaceae bacterium]|nr:hypothetical protein [Pyrinomonadaceae bacterium]
MGQSVRSINQQILGMNGPDNLIFQTIPAIALIDVTRFVPGQSDPLNFTSEPLATGRLGIFAAEKDGVERAVIMLLPQSGTPDTLLICITQGFAQAAQNLEPLHWSNPLSPEFIRFALLKHVINRWGAQMLASHRNMALMYILRSRGNELGPFARDGNFLRFVLDEIASSTGDSFTYPQVEAFTFSSGIYEFNNFITGVSGSVNITAVYAIDPVHSTVPTAPQGARRRQYASGTAGPLLPSFERLPLGRWQNEDEYNTPKRNDVFQYLHNKCMPMYVLYLALRTP